MTDKNWERVWQAGILLAVFFFGAGVGGFIVSERYDVEIMANQLDLQGQVYEIVKDKAKIDNLTQQLIIHIEQLKLEREDLQRLQIELSKGEIK